MVFDSEIELGLELAFESELELAAIASVALIFAGGVIAAERAVAGFEHQIDNEVVDFAEKAESAE